jgi:hypothetical protein
MDFFTIINSREALAGFSFVELISVSHGKWSFHQQSPHLSQYIDSGPAQAPGCDSAFHTGTQTGIIIK